MASVGAISAQHITQRATKSMAKLTSHSCGDIQSAACLLFQAISFLDLNSIGNYFHVE